jgi:hypothetical protein
MAILKFLISIIMFSITISFFKVIRMQFSKYYYSLTEKIRKIYRVLNVKKRSKVVWEELIKMHKNENWHFGQFDNEKYIVTTFNLKDEKEQKFRYEVTQNSLKYHTFILDSFDEHKTIDIMVLASHLNSSLNFGKVSVNTKFNCVEFVHFGDLVTYMLFPGEIRSDLRLHYEITLDCFWAFSNLIETGDDPVFVFSELMRRYNKEDDTSN